MYHEDAMHARRSGGNHLSAAIGGTLLVDVPNEEAGMNWDEQDELEMDSWRDDWWDVFLLDEETAEPEPEHGDFWGQPDDGEPI